MNDFHLALKILESLLTSRESLISINQGMFIVLQCFSLFFFIIYFFIDLLTVHPVYL